MELAWPDFSAAAARLDILLVLIPWADAHG
jgi:hypothetical protein